MFLPRGKGSLSKSDIKEAAVISERTLVINAQSR